VSIVLADRRFGPRPRSGAGSVTLFFIALRFVVLVMCVTIDYFVIPKFVGRVSLGVFRRNPPASAEASAGKRASPP
jgi:hypothetical protein